ncbi:MAG: aminotransferase class I/II-fold pyridoxal phosphate-dependent enzyme [Elusimicrobia bacterium]|nr:aminotransferase class I/II-fold pyridoxal phosphate-dependent enzyme [Elusimicrobiota bacterium]
MDIFKKCSEFTIAKQIQSMDLYPYFHTVESGQNPVVISEGKKMVMMGSNNYLGLATDQRLKNAAIFAVQKYGSGCVGSRFLNGTLDIHVRLERELAKFIGKPAVLVFTTGMQANLGAISSIVGKNDYVITDKFDHASIIDGCRLSYGKMVRFKHNDLADLEDVLKNLPEESGKLVVVDGVFSMEGDVAPLDRMVPLVHRYGGRIMVDDAHGIGVLGKNGRGTCDHYGVTDEVDLIMGTFSKSFAAIGGFIAGSDEIIHYIKHNGRALIFSAAPSPADAAAALKALEIIKKDSRRRHRLIGSARYMRDKLKKLGFDTGNSTTPIIPVVIGEDFDTFKMWRLLYDRGIFTTPVITPAVPPGRGLIRVSIMATHTKRHLDKACDAFYEAGCELGIIKKGAHRKKRGRIRKSWAAINKWMRYLWKSKPSKTQSS